MIKVLFSHFSCMKHKPACFLTCTLLVVGGLNWGLVGVGYLMGSNWNVVNMLLGSWPMVEAVVYILVGLAALLFGGMFFANADKCACNKS